ncbi:uncharacterized protein K452DRAFT_233226 [Aplosporella prunicola CBS 121167]|uniref:Zn(2)-C6 fungal-type domain-containing protein n=1 Tax=Aplosporella prunicola CBS 121167 TaxID=1176127 RepID=A0A6A6B572_9PEZI|nr:uncharacterized protein K452DRAFT_233226 [Aplosporella prunicola CBS 121167]KAF2139006.1 hypothetical protein K452DRAFT_233226 [Aplosporella prunicola CBS 121167]
MAAPPPQQPAQPASPTKSVPDDPKNKRVNQACILCRKRKSRCHLDYENGRAKLPCARCKRESLECVLGGSNRGGRRVRRKTLPDNAPSNIAPSGSAQTPSGPFSSVGVGGDNVSFHGLGNMGTATATSPVESRLNFSGLEPSNARPHPVEPAQQTAGSPSMEFANLQNPSDALGILARVAEEGTPANAQHRSSFAQPGNPERLHTSYRLLAEGKLTWGQVFQLLQRYKTYYHPYFPLVPPQTFDTTRLYETAQREPHLLTAILVIASKDLIEETHTYEVCSAHMKSLVADLAAGGPGDVEAVEALLLLAEWTPYTQRAHSGKVGKGEEDREAWNSSGVALRLAYYLGLEKYSFKVDDDGKDPQFSRKLLVWTACYIADRQISIRIGKAFWSRGPGPLTTLRRENYPSLLPKNPNDEDYASIFQATLELTSLFSNVHDVLYSNVGTSFRSHLSGSYIKFIDDFRAATYGWKAVWGTLTCSPHLKAMLLMSYDYLRLYVNAFAFQATVRRVQASLNTSENPASTTTSPAFPQSPSRVFYNNVGAVGDARFIYEGLDAAKAILTTANNFVDPEKALRFMPLRFYLYLVYAGVFLFRAKCVGVVGAEEERGVRRMVGETVERLQRSAVGGTHLGSRYSQLLRLLWMKADSSSIGGAALRAGAAASRSGRVGAAFNPATAPVSHATPSASSQVGSTGGREYGVPDNSSPLAGGGHSGNAPAGVEQIGDFSWTDLSAVGEFAVNGYNGQGLDQDALWGGFLPLEVGGVWDVGQFDMNGGAGSSGSGGSGGGSGGAGEGLGMMF